MLDIGFTELLLIGTVALVVIGPEKLPKVARTVGHLIGRAQRYVSDVKSDIQREVQLDELRKLRTEVETAARQMQQTVTSQVTDIEKEFREAEQQFEKLAKDTAKEVKADETAEAAPALSQPASPVVEAASDAVSAPTPQEAVAANQPPGSAVPAATGPAAASPTAAGIGVATATAAAVAAEPEFDPFNDPAPSLMPPASAAQVVPLAGLGSPVAQSRELDTAPAVDPLEQAVFALHDADREEQLQAARHAAAASTQAQLPGIEPAVVSTAAAAPVGPSEKSA